MLSTPPVFEFLKDYFEDSQVLRKAATVLTTDGQIANQSLIKAKFPRDLKRPILMAYFSFHIVKMHFITNVLNFTLFGKFRTDFP